MAQWSEKKEAERKVAKLKSLLDERMELFKKFRDAGWEVRAVERIPTTGVHQMVYLPDDTSALDPHFEVKMPGAAAMRIRTIDRLYRLAKGPL